MLVWEVFAYADTPYPALSNDEVPPFVAGGGVPESPKDVAADMCGRRLACASLLTRRSGNLLSSCWQRGVALRPSFSDLLATLTAIRQKLDAAASGDAAAAEDAPAEAGENDVYKVAELPDIQVTAEPL